MQLVQAWPVEDAVRLSPAIGESDWTPGRQRDCWAVRSEVGDRILHKAAEKRRLANRIAERLQDSTEIKPFPEAVTRLLAACQNHDMSTRELEIIIACDPSLAGRILRLANSPLFCPAIQIKSVANAINFLGLRRLRSIAMTLAGAAVFSDGDHIDVGRRRLWQHSVGCASVASRLAQLSPMLDEEMAFLAGMFHDVGKLLFFEAIPEEYVEVDKSLSGEQLVDEEEFLFGTTHAKVGLLSATDWELPAEVKMAAGYHHTPQEAPECHAYAKLIHISNDLSKHWNLGAAVSIDPGEACAEEAKRVLRVNDEQLEKVRSESRAVFNEAMVATAH